jgi:hypothetical protein
MSFSDKAFHASGNTVVIGASTASTNVALSVAITGSAPQVMVGNLSTSWANVAFGSSTVTATVPTTAAAAAGYMIPPDGSAVLHPGSGTYVAGALQSAGASGQLYFTPGSGR